ncbi:hypothetical protein [Pelagibacterium sediminicola]|uniref:hypothetical protein n=1 Tax=Pelagibacterium sediminicola TaxID=2248761 RepID=UPI000E30D8EB|nr:hypothetical protein [Pelagibacterium sediminicola]
MAERRQEIVDMPLRLLSKLGEDGLSARTDAGYIAIAQAGLFGCFASKDGLWIEGRARIEHPLSGLEAGRNRL